MSITVLVGPEAVASELPDGATAERLFDDRSVVVARVNGELRDLDATLRDGDRVEAVTIDEPEGLAVLRHSCAHVLAQAVQSVDPDAKLGIGPPIADGFYYDFGVERPFTPEDLAALEKRMQAIIKSGQRFVRRPVTDDEARTELEFQPYKLQLISKKGGPGGAFADEPDPDIMEVGGEQLTMYDNVDRRDQTVWTDLCRGPHVPTTRYIPANAFKLMRSAAYWLSDERNPQLQRIYGTAWRTRTRCGATWTSWPRPPSATTGAWARSLTSSASRSRSAPAWRSSTPGGVIRREMEEYSRRRHEEAGYDFVNTPHITRAASSRPPATWTGTARACTRPCTWTPSTTMTGKCASPAGLLPEAHELPHAQPDLRRPGPLYRELPLRLFEFGTVYRYEKSGVVHGLTRARGFHPGRRAHLLHPEQMPGELANLLSFVLDLLRDYGLDDFELELSTRDPDKSVGEDSSGRRRRRRCGPRPRRRAWTSCSIPAGRLSTDPRSLCRPRTPWAGRGRCRPSRWTSSCRSASTWNTPLPMAASSGR